MNNCHFCGRPIKDGYRLVDVAKNKAVNETHLCDSCGTAYVQGCFAEESTSSSPPQPTSKQPQNVKVTVINSAAELLALLLNKSSNPQPMVQKTDIGPCEKCGHTVSELRETGRFGCPDCYKHFDNLIVSIVDIAQKGAKKHTGKVPKRFVDTTEQDEKLRILKLRLARAIEHEQYEDAAKINEQIKELESGEK